jgi:translation initiation factor IF-3
MDGDQLGVMETNKALALAKEKGLDLVEVSGNTRPPICKILDYGKFKYDEKKKAKEKRANSTKIETKEMKFRPKTDSHDMDFKCRHVGKFLTEGNRCKLVVFFKGRERAHPRVGNDLLMRVAERFEDIAEVTQSPSMEGNRMTMMLAPRPKAPAKEASGGQEK